MTANTLRALIVDRDGTLIPDLGYPREPNRVRLMPNAASALAQLRSAGFLIVLASNQSGIGRGMLSWRDVLAVHAQLEELLHASGVALDGAYYCPHAPDDGCVCRKPRPGLLLRAADELGLDLRRSIVVGDKESDIEAGLATHSNTILFQPIEGVCVTAATHVARSWVEVASYAMRIEHDE